MKQKKIYLDIILPLPVKGTFTYFTYNNLLLGQRVIVQFGARKIYTGIINSIHFIKPVDYLAKEIIAIIDEMPIVNEKQLNFWSWISDYYMCNLGEVMNAALPTSFKLVSESSIIINPCFDGDLSELSSDEAILVDLLSNDSELKMSEVTKLLKIKSTYKFINDLITKEVVIVNEVIHDKYKEKKVKVIDINCSKEKIEQMSLTLKQRLFIEGFFDFRSLNKNREIIVSDLLSNLKLSRSILKNLVRKGVFKIKDQSVSRLSVLSKSLEKKKVLEDFQLTALANIRNVFRYKDVCLLHGVTSSGKTELYIKLIQDTLKEKKTVLYLLPEIALTTQIIKRLQLQFGDKVGVTHSRLNNNERVEVWNAVNSESFDNIKYPLMLGARSSLFLPYNNLGLIIVDEEHDSSFKQSQNNPRYNARDSAIYLSKLHNAKVLLGSATPCLESFYNVKKKKYGFVEMKTRYKGISMPKIQTIDIKKAYLKKQMTNHFSSKLLSKIYDCLNERKQVILFQNRRGYSPTQSCNSCSFTPQCKYCDVSLTFYKHNNHLKCHFCGYTEGTIKICPNCMADDFKDIGFGTEQIEESLKMLFPDNIIKRMDYDTTRGKNSYKILISDFERGKIDILVGTQMVTKGLDFDNVGLVGILNADKMLHFPDFRSYERAFQLMMQVSGRSGRKGDVGSVFIQTFDEDHEVFSLLKSNDYSSFVLNQTHERKMFNYPPYCKIISIKIKHKNQNRLDDASLYLSSMMKRSFGGRVLGPEYPIISRVKNYFIKNIILKIEKESSFIEAKKILQLLIEKLLERKEFRSAIIVIDVDPD